MSKHSKWAKVKRQKGVTDVKRAALFTKLGRIVTVAAREGGGEINFNFKLRTAVDQALAANMPKDNIERAIKKGTGAAEGAQIETVVYEGFGPGGVAVLVEALTDNRNRTVAKVKHAFSTHGGNLAATGAVQWMFERKGVIRVEGVTKLSDEVELAVIDAGADDISVDDEGMTITASVEGLVKVEAVARQNGLRVEYAGLEWLPKEKGAALDTEAQAKNEELLETLEDDEDVNEVYSTLD